MLCRLFLEKVKKRYDLTDLFYANIGTVKAEAREALDDIEKVSDFCG